MDRNRLLNPSSTKKSIKELFYDYKWYILIAVVVIVLLYILSTNLVSNSSKNSLDSLKKNSKDLFNKSKSKNETDPPVAEKSVTA